MNTTTLMTWQTFKSKLEQHQDLTLQFQYAEEKWVDASYHITEKLNRRLLYLLTVAER